MAGTDSNSIWDRLGNLAEKVAGGYFDYQVAKTESEAASETLKAEQLRAGMIDQLSRSFALGANTAGQYVSGLPAWVVPAAVLGLGGLLVYKFAK